jgi:hypothetical protein
MATYLNFDVGGRPYNSQDFAAVQGQIIDATQIYAAFNGGNNYIIQGCTVRGAAGTVWLDGKVRAVQADVTINNATPFPLYIISQDTQVSRVYADGQAKVAFNVFNAVWSTIAPAAGIPFLQFNSQNDLNNNRLVTFITPNAVPVQGGTFTGDIVVVDTVRTTSAYGSPIGSSLFGSTGLEGAYLTGIGFNSYFNGNSYIQLGDGANNAGGGIAMQYSSGAAPTIKFYLAPTTNGADRLLSAADVNTNTRMTLNHFGDLTLQRTLFANGNVIVGDNVASSRVTTPRIDMQKNGNVSTINFAGSVNDPGFIQHEEINNTATLRFSVSDDASGDSFQFGSTPPQGFTVAFSVLTSGQGTFSNTCTATDFIIPSDRRLKTNISDIDKGLEVINKLRPVEFDMIKDNMHKAGFIAQEVLKVINHAVIEPHDEKDMLSLKEAQIIPYLVKAVQELSAEVEKLKNQLAK